MKSKPKMSPEEREQQRLSRIRKKVGRLGGLAGGPIGGKSTSKAKVKAARKNLQAAHRARRDPEVARIMAECAAAGNPISRQWAHKIKQARENATD